MKRRAIVATVSALSMLFPTAIAHAAPDPTTKVELVVPESKFVAEKVTFDPSLGRTEGLAALKELRGYMWDQNPPFKGYGFEGYTGTLRDAAAKVGITTKAQFQNVTADEDANWMAIQRAVEASEVFQHKRPDGSSTKTATRGTKAPHLESLSSGMSSLRSAIVDQWGKGELADLRAQDGVWSDKNGHLVHLIHPNHKHFGFGLVNVGGRYFAAAVNVATTSGADTTAGGRQTATIYRAAKPGETPTGITQPTDPGTGDNGGSSMDSSMIGMIVGIIALILTLIGGVGFTLPIRL